LTNIAKRIISLLQILNSFYKVLKKIIQFMIHYKDWLIMRLKY